MFGSSAPRLEPPSPPARGYDLATAAAGPPVRPKFRTSRWFDERVGTDDPSVSHRPTTAALVARAVAVVCLLGIAAVALSGRRGLEWGRLTQAPDGAWAQVVVGAAAAALVVAAGGGPRVGGR